MIDAKTLEYQYDEENQGFATPAQLPAPASSIGTKIAVALLALGTLAAVAAIAGGVLAGTWLGLLLIFGPLFGGGGFYFWLRYRQTTPGIKHDAMVFSSTTGRGLWGWALAVVFTGFYVLLYWFPQHLTGAIVLLDPLSQLMAGSAADQWFLYGFLYTAAVLVFGLRMFMKYRHNRYQIVRTASVMFFQLGFAFVLPNLLKMLQQPEYYFTYFWPLKHQYLWPAQHGIGWILNHPGRLGLFMILWGVIASFVATPVLTYFFGKRWYCAWVCGCGGLAETLGDPWRHLSSKSTAAWKLERWLIHSILVAITLITAVLWLSFATDGAVLGSATLPLAKWYGFFIGAMFAGVVGVGFYPLLGSRVWCRFGCPQAAVLGILQRLFSRFRITTNGGQCMSCGNCSKYCEMGIDVRAYAQQGENIVRASCVGCGVCSAVCPRGVLKLENGPSKGRFTNSRERPR